MLAKKVPLVTPSGRRRHKVDLQQLYARRSAIDGLIASLEEYGRYRARRLGERKRKVA